MAELNELLTEVRACTICVNPKAGAGLTDGARPVVQMATTSRIVIIGQAPGRRVHESGVPFDDPSGTRLRSWLGVDDDTFYDPQTFAIIPMGFCFPGNGSSGDLPPRPECAPQWHDRLLSHLTGDTLTILIGQYALGQYAPAFSTVTEAVKAWPDLLPERIALPHPSPPNNRWLRSNPWFDDTTVPALRKRVAEVLG